MEDAWGGEGLVPAEMPQVGVVDVMQVFAVQSFQRTVHLAAADGFDQFVALAVEDVEWYVFDARGVGRVATAADGYGSGKGFGIALQGVPGAEASHRDAADVDARGVNGVGAFQTVDNCLYCAHLRCGFGFHLMGWQSPVGVDPALVFGTLRQHKQKRVVLANGVVNEETDTMAQLLIVVVATLACAMQEDHQGRRRVAAGCLVRRVEQIRHSVGSVDVLVAGEEGAVGHILCREAQRDGYPQQKGKYGNGTTHRCCCSCYDKYHPLKSVWFQGVSNVVL